MGLLDIIRRMYKRQMLSIREIARLTGVARNIMTKHLAANTIEPKFATPERHSKLEPFAAKLAGWSKTEVGKSRKQRRTVKQLHTDFVALGFTGSYGRVAAFARRWRADRQREQQTTGRGTFVPLHFEPGDALQFDWSEDFAVLGGERTKLQMPAYQAVAQPGLSAARFCSAAVDPPVQGWFGLLDQSSFALHPTKCRSMPTGTHSGAVALAPISTGHLGITIEAGGSPEHVLMSEVEIITDGRRRRWTAAETLRIVEEPLDDRTRISVVALALCRFRGHEDKIVTWELAIGHIKARAHEGVQV